jgi:hypothetical protein
VQASRYAVRTEALLALGYESYQAYLDSDLWKSIRERIFIRDHRLCRVCGKNPARSVHHITYSVMVLSGRDDSQLTAICGGCHKAVEFDGDKKLTYTTDIFTKLSRRSSLSKKHGGRQSTGSIRKLRPRCRCCLRQVKKLGRDDFCMKCYKSGRVLKFRQKQATA